MALILASELFGPLDELTHKTAKAAPPNDLFMQALDPSQRLDISKLLDQLDSKLPSAVNASGHSTGVLNDLEFVSAADEIPTMSPAVRRALQDVQIASIFLRTSNSERDKQIKALVSTITPVAALPSVTVFRLFCEHYRAEVCALIHAYFAKGSTHQITPPPTVLHLSSVLYPVSGAMPYPLCTVCQAKAMLPKEEQSTARRVTELLRQTWESAKPEVRKVFEDKHRALRMVINARKAAYDAAVRSTSARVHAVVDDMVMLAQNTVDESRRRDMQRRAADQPQQIAQSTAGVSRPMGNLTSGSAVPANAVLGSAYPGAPGQALMQTAFGTAGQSSQPPPLGMHRPLGAAATSVIHNRTPSAAPASRASALGVVSAPAQSLQEVHRRAAAATGAVAGHPTPSGPSASEGGLTHGVHPQPTVSQVTQPNLSLQSGHAGAGIPPGGGRVGSLPPAAPTQGPTRGGAISGASHIVSQHITVMASGGTAAHSTGSLSSGMAGLISGPPVTPSSTTTALRRTADMLGAAHESKRQKQ